MHHYQAIARTLLYLDAAAPRRPALAELARHAGMSPFHLQRIFTRWAGVSPRRFSQILAREIARAALRDSRSVLDATWRSGLSSSGRLHDLFVKLDAVTPGTELRRGCGLELAVGFHASPFGTVLLAASELGIAWLSFVIHSRQQALAALRKRWPKARLVERQRRTGALAEEVFAGFPPAGHGPPAPLALLVRGTNFQVKVWEALLRIPPGALTTYQQVATAIGEPEAARAVGNAVGQNPVAFLIPCHRVIRSTGALGDYRWGSQRKRLILAWEALRTGSYSAPPPLPTNQL